MNVKLRVLTIGVLFFTGHSLMAQKAKKDTVTKTKDIEEVVVLGTYGIKESQEQRVGSYSKVTAEMLEKPNALSVDLAIAGQVSGTIINSNSGQPGSNARVLIRGISSLTGETQPLYIVDGVPVLTGDAAGVATTSNALAMINPSDIESVEVLKDGATTSLYGSRGAAGVIIIKTKSGRKGKSKLTLTSEYGIGSPGYEKYEFLNASEQVGLLAQGFMNINPALSAEQAYENAKNTFNWDGKTNQNWQDAVRRSAAASSRYNLSYAGGTENIKAYGSVGYTEQEGITRDALYKRLNATLKLDVKATERLNLVFSNLLARATQLGPLDYGYFSNPILSSRFFSQTQPVYNADGSYNFDIISSMTKHFNPVAIQDINKRKSVFTKILSSIGAEYNIAKDFRFSSNFGVDFNYYDEGEYWNPDFGDGVRDGDPNGNGVGVKSDFNYTYLNWSNFLHYDFKIKDDHKFTLSAGTEATIKTSKFTSNSSQNFLSQHYELNQVSDGSVPTAANSYTERYSLIGYITRASYSFKNYFNVMGSFRRDGFSHFGADKKYGNFWGTGLNVNFHKFGNVSEYFQNLQLRASYGEIGNYGGDSYLYQNNPYLSLNSYASEIGYYIGTVGNRELQWETAKKSNIGVDVGIIDNKLRFSVDYYHHLIADQLTRNIANPGSTGAPNLVGNGLESVSKGLETSLSFDIFNNPNFKWNLNANYSYNTSEITKLKSDYVAIDGFKRYVVGHNPSEFYLAHYYGVDQSNGDALWYTDATHTTLSNGTGSSEVINRDFTGKNAMPTHTAGLTNTFNYKGWSLSALATYAGDFYVYDLWERYFNADGQDIKVNQLADALNSWTPANPNATRPQYRPNNPVPKHHSTRYLRKGDYIKLKSVELGYKFDKNTVSALKMSNIYLYLRGVNLFTKAFDDQLNFDPEANSNHMGTVAGMGIYDQTQPILKQVMFGVVIDF